MSYAISELSAPSSAGMLAASSASSTLILFLDCSGTVIGVCGRFPSNFFQGRRRGLGSPVGILRASQAVASGVQQEVELLALPR